MFISTYIFHSSFLRIFHIIFWRFKLKLKTVIIILRYAVHVIVAHTNFICILHIFAEQNGNNNIYVTSYLILLLLYVLS